MEPCKSLILANSVLNGLIVNKNLKNCCTYHSYYSGGLEPDGFCGYIIREKCKRDLIKIIFYGVRNNVDKVRIYIVVNGNSRVRDKRLNVKDAIQFITDKIIQFRTDA